MKDPRDKALIEQHTTLARDLAASKTREIQELVKANQSLKDATFTYSLRLAFGGLLFIVLDSTFLVNGTEVADLNCLGGGLAVGASVVWGTAWLNTDVKTLIGQSGAIEAQLNVAATQVNYWAGGTYVGSGVCGGISLAAGVFGGGGTWKQ